MEKGESRGRSEAPIPLYRPLARLGIADWQQDYLSIASSAGHKRMCVSDTGKRKRVSNLDLYLAVGYPLE